MPDHETSQFGPDANGSEPFRKAPQDAESFRSVPNPTEPFRILPKAAERTENHILTVREAAKLFEAAGVTRTERSITNWCQPNRTGVARLDAYFDANDRKYFITPQSVDAAIKEELAKAARHSESSEGLGKIPQDSERAEQESHGDGNRNSNEIQELRFKLRESEISSKVKDQYIAKLEGRYDSTQKELLSYSRTLGQLETRLLQLEGPKEESSEMKRVRVVSETDRSDSEATKDEMPELL